MKANHTLSLLDYSMSSRELVSLTQKLYNARSNDDIYLTLLVQKNGEEKYLSDPSFKEKLSAKHIADFDKICSLKKEVDLQAAKCVKVWCENVSVFNPDCYVFTIGSGHQPKQQIPQFAKNRKKGFTAILNLDIYKCEHDKTDNCSVSYLGAHLNAGSKLMDEFIESIGKLLASGKKVIVLDFCVPTHIIVYVSLLEKYKLHIDKNLSFLQGYFISCPVFQIHAGAITADINHNFDNVIDGFEGGGPNPELKNPAPAFTTRFVHLDNVTYDHFFRPELGESLTSDTPSNASGRFFSRPQQYDKRILDNFFENRATFDETDDGKASWEMTNQELIDSIMTMVPEDHRANIDLFTIKRSDIEKLIQSDGAVILNLSNGK